MRNRITQALDSAPSYIGDNGFIGVNMRLDPSALPPGYVSEAINCRFRNGIAETRKGYVKVAWMNKVPKAVGAVTRTGGTATFTATFPHGFSTGDSAIITGLSDSAYNGTKTVTVTGSTTFTYSVSGTPATPDPNTGYAVVNKVQAWGTVHGIGEFKDPNTLTNYTVIAAGDYVYFTSENNSAWQLALPSGVTITDSVTFTQCYDTLIMFRGNSLPPLAMPNVDTGFQNIVQTLANVASGTNVIPPAVRGLFFQNRLFIPNDNDEIVVSDFNDYTRYQPVVQELKVNQGSSDSIVNMAKFNDTTIIAFKQNSVYAISNIYGNLGAAVQDQITDQFGLVAAESVAHCGADLLFLSQMGVMSLRQTEQNKIQGVSLPLSEPIQPLIDRINWKYAGNAKAAYWDNKYYLAVPLDEAYVLGPEKAGGEYPVSGTMTFPVTQGATYRWVMGALDISLTNGSETLTRSADFVAAGTTVTLTGVGEEFTDGSLKQTWLGVNNAVLVYDFLNQAWAGYDTCSGFSVSKFHIRRHNNTDRLFAIGQDGHILMAEEDYVDHLSTPFTEVLVNSAPANGNTIIVNSGVTITASGTNNGATTWGAVGVSAASAAKKLWSTDGYGYSPASATTVWTSPNTTPSLLTSTAGVEPFATGIRFYSTNGWIPTVTATGSWYTITENTSQSIPTTIVTRGYAPDGGESLSDFDWLCFDMQTWNPNYSVSLLTDGPFETHTVASSITKSRTAYTVFGRAAFTQSNVNGDHDTDHREDYSVSIGTGTGSVAGVYFDGGLDLTRHQEFREEYKIRKRGRSARVKFVSSQGRLRLMGCKLESRKKQIRAGGKT